MKCEDCGRECNYLNRCDCCGSDLCDECLDIHLDESDFLENEREDD